MKWDLPGKSPIVSSSWTTDRLSRRTRRKISSPIRSTRGPSCFSARFCGEGWANRDGRIVSGEWQIDFLFAIRFSQQSHLFERHTDGATLLEPVRHRQVLGAHEIRIEQFGLVAASVVAQHRHDGMARSEFFSQTNGAGNVDAG